MSLRHNIELLFQVGFDNNLEDSAWEREVQQLLDTCFRHVAHSVKLEALASDVAISMGDVAQGRVLYIESDLEITFKLNGVGTTAINLSRPVDSAASQAATVKAHLLLEGQFTSLHVSNPSASAVANLKILILGDLTA